MLFIQVFTFMSFVVSIVVISTLADELVAILKSLGVVSNMSASYLGLSVMAWGNSMGDMISNMALARRGLQHMAFAACFGGPMFNTLVAMGGVLFVKVLHSKDGIAHVRNAA